MDWRSRAWIIHSTVTGDRCGTPDDIHFLALALCGEVGELANLVKKDWRQAWGEKVDQARLEAEIADEIADANVYLYLLARALNVDMNVATDRKLIEVEKRYGPEVRAALALASEAPMRPAQAELRPEPTLQDLQREYSIIGEKIRRMVCGDPSQTISIKPRP